MPDSPLLAAGAQVQPTSAAPLHTNEFFTGMWTQSNPLGPGAVPFLYHHGYGLSRFDRLVGGANCEITTRLTLARRPGSSVYNSSHFPPINRFYSWRGFSSSGESIRIVASVDPGLGQVQGTVRDVTGPSTNTILWTKDRNAGRTSFVSVGNILYWGDGVDTKLLVQSSASWGAGPSTVVGTINATQAVRVTVLFLGTHITQTILICTLVAPVPALVENQEILFAGVTNAALLNGQIYPYQAIVQGWAATALGVPLTSHQVAFNISNLPSYNLGFPLQADTGTIATSGSNFNTGDFIIDSNGNIQEAVGAQTATITNIQVDSHVLPGGATGRLVTLFFDPTTPLDIPNGVNLTLSGMTTVPGLNGTQAGVSVESSLQVQFLTASFGVPVTAFSVETGTADTGNGVSGPTQPVWNAALGGITIDGGQQWVNKGSATQDWGIPAPVNPPTVTQAVAPTVYPSWAALTWYSPTAFVIVDSSGNLQQLVVGGVTGGAAPAWSAVVGAITVDNTAQWKCLGPAAWQASHAYALNDVVQSTYTYYITVELPPTSPPWTPIPHQIAVTVTNAFRCITAGTSGTNAPSWPNGINTTVTDNGVTWLNIGTAPAWPGAAQNLSLATKILDSNGNIQAPQLTGKTGSAAPTWMMNVGESTTDGAQTWLLTQAFAPAATGAVQYAYSGKSSVTGQIGTASPMSDPITVTAGNQVVIQGDALPNPPADIIVLWRTLQGGSTLFYLDEFPNPGAPATWVYTDTTPDSGLNQLIPAPIAGQNNPPPIGFVPHAYYLGRIFGYTKNILQWSAGPNVLPGQGSGDQSFRSKDFFTLPSLGVTCWPTSIGLICYTLSDVWVLLGQGTDNSPFYMVNFQEGVGLASKDALTVNGSTAYGMLTSGQVVSMDPGAGELEIGFPIGDLFNQSFVPSETYCAWHLGSSSDMALYVADGLTSWFRMAAVAAPESGNVWSPRAIPRTAIKAIASVETTPGIRVLLLGPGGYNQPILRRDPSTNADNGETFAAYADVAPVVLAQPGTTVGVQYLVTEETRIAGATAITASLTFDEITSSDFLPLRNKSLEPPLLAQSETVNAQRHWVAQDANTVQVCRYIQQRLSWPAENFANELLTNTIYGRVPEKARK
jgi:hypothetical protein